MASRVLQNKPLVECILELRWELVDRGPGVTEDPHYQLLLGRLYDRLSSDYPAHEQLPAATIPHEIAGHTVQHRFRSKPQGWPLVQVGPGILTLNDTDGYLWPDFRKRAIDAKLKLFEAHPNPQNLRINALTLRYVDAVEHDYTKSNIFDFLGEKMGTTLSLPSSLFEDTPVDPTPQHCVWQSVFHCREPAGSVQVRFATGQNKNRPALIWETVVQSIQKDVPSLPDGFDQWIDAAHKITGDWFFKLIQGDLMEKFK